MMDKIEMSLDEIISKTKGPRQQKGKGNSGQQKRAPFKAGGRANGGGRVQKRRGGGAGGVSGGRPRFPRGDVNSTWKHDMFDGPRKNRIGSQGPTKLLISNLDFGVSESDIKELFSEFSTTGPLKGHSVHYDRSGRSLGTADIVFERRADALKAMKTYNGVPLDGRPMSIQIATSEVAPALARAVRTAAPARRNTGGRGGFRGKRETSAKRGGRGSGAGGARRQAPTVEELDAELDAYTKDMKI
ncbi:THO complex subunit 4 [Culicoides brevitarsis]|uniref:THO complex subunit 4 n=1 Tax=Culicoides brevitarsis TaxID=469753 RepID=UPI00307BA905